MATKLLPFGSNLFKYSLNISRLIVQNQKFSYKSSISLDKIYPNSSLKITTPAFVPLEPNEKFSGFIPIEKLDITYSCSSGPGGQNVNNVRTKVDLRFKVSEATWLDASIREKLISLNQNKLSNEGYLIIKSELTRSQQLNLADCMQKLRKMIRKAAEPKPQISEETLEMLRRRKEKANRERLYVKRNDSLKRASSQAPTVHDL